MLKDDGNLWSVAAANLVGDRGGGQGAPDLADGSDRSDRSVLPVLPVLISGRYRADRVLGAGGSATAIAAIDEVTGERRVLKVFHPENPAAARRASDEFRRLHELSHPSVVRVRDLARSPDGLLYLVTDEVEGPSISSVAQVTSTSARREAFARVARDLADALAYLHGRGVVHGDLAPGNVRLDGQGRPVLLDFDLAGPRGAARAGGGATGTLGYASPEALVGER